MLDNILPIYPAPSFFIDIILANAWYSEYDIGIKWGQTIQLIEITFVQRIIIYANFSEFYSFSWQSVEVVEICLAVVANFTLVKFIKPSFVYCSVQTILVMSLFSGRLIYIQIWLIVKKITEPKIRCIILLVLPVQKCV